MGNTASGTKKERIAWVDILRFLGMTLIYWGHLGTSGNVTLYIFAHHVPLFFFISGFFSGTRKQAGSFGAFLWKKIRSLVFPYLVFTILFYGMELITGAMTFSDLPGALLISAEGIRNQVPGPLWFFTCLFVVVCVFELVKRIAYGIFGDSRAAGFFAILAAAILYAVGICFLGHEPAQDPEWIWNVDSAFVYILYYALGALCFPWIRDFSYKKCGPAGKFFFFLCFGLSAAFGVFTILYGVRVTELAAGRFQGGPLFELYGLVSALILIFFEICLARMIGLIPGIRRFLAYIGKDSLYLCGNELIIKYFGGLLISAAGLQGLMGNDLFLLLYSIVCLIVLTFTLDYPERLLFGPLFGSGRIRFRS